METATKMIFEKRIATHNEQEKPTGILLNYVSIMMWLLPTEWHNQNQTNQPAVVTEKEKK